MLTSREITAALSHPVGAGPQRLLSMAIDALHRADAGPWPDPRRIIIGLGRAIRIVTRADHRAELEAGGERVKILWHPEPTEFGLSGFIGAALVVFDDHGVQPSPGDVMGLAGYIALPEPGLAPDYELAAQTFAPPWFLEAHQRRRRWAESGLYAAVR